MATTTPNGPTDLNPRFRAQAFSALNSIVAPLVRAGVGSPLPGLGVGAVVLETTGRKSGKPRQVPLLALRVGDRVYASTVRSNSQWVRNLEAESKASVYLWGSARPAEATMHRANLHRGMLQIAELDLREEHDDTNQRTD